MKLLIVYLFVAKLFLLSNSINQNDGRPNFVFFMADDLGFGDVSSFGNKTVTTPNIDRLAFEGVHLTHSVTGSPTSTASRAAFLTGRLPIRYGLVGKLTSVISFVANRAGLPQTELTFAKILKRNGYSTALIGKWHLGLDCDWQGDKCHHPNTHGFEYFYGIPLTNYRENGDEIQLFVSVLLYPGLLIYLISILFVSSLTAFFAWYRSHYLLAIVIGIVGLAIPGFLASEVLLLKELNSMVMRNDDVVEQPIKLNTLSRRMVRESLNFVEKAKENPFLLFLSFSQVHLALDVEDRFKNSGSHGLYGDSIREMDWSVGQVMDKIRDLGLRENTVILFTSVHGAHIKEVGSNYPFSGGKTSTMEGGLRVPTIISWPGHLPANSEVHAPTTLMDIFPTVLSLSGIQTPKHIELDGRDLSPLLNGTNTSSPHKFMFHYGAHEEIYAVRFIENEESVWKVHFHKQECGSFCYIAYKLEEPLVFNVVTDPSESQPLLSSTSKYLKIVKKVQEAIALHKRQTYIPPTQLSATNSLWRPWLQRCCNFPFCNCLEDETIIP